jgi:diguanylate cyclase (GGDEF)-like protein/PAS domain S-box-containing protein
LPQRQSDIFLTILQTLHAGVFLIPLSSAFEGSMAQQRKLPMRPEKAEEPDKLNGALAILAAHRRDAILEAVAMSAKELLGSANLEQSLPKVIERIGLATGVDRVHILKIDPTAPDQGSIVQHHLWSALGISTPPLFKDAKGAAMVDIGLQSWLRRLATGKVVGGHVRDFEEPARKFFESAGVKSAMAVPVFANGHLWGHVGLDDCRDEREWSPAEIDTLKTLAELIGATVSARRHEAILEAVAMSAKELLRSSDLQQSLLWVMERLGQATGVDRVHLIEIDTDTPTEQSPVVQHYVWSAPGVSSSINYEEIKEPMAEVGLESWVPRLIRGETVVGNTRDFAPAARTLLERGNVKSTMAVPVFVDGQWWGLIAFDECGFERHWGPAEIDTFKTLAELVGAAVARTRHLKTLADANRIVENSATVLYRLDLKPPFPLIFVSQNICRYGYQADELLAHPERWAQIIDPADLPVMVDDIRSISEGKMDSNQKEFRVRKPDGSIVWFDGHGRALHDGENRLVAVEGILTDITDRKLAAEQIAMLARTDSLTGIPNRAAFLERLNLEFARAKRGANQFAVHYLDLDHFKDVNDTLGHPIGDALLRAVAERLQSCVRETDMVARFGGDEFAVLQDNVEDIADIETLAAKMGEILAAPFAIEGNQVQTTASIGIVPYRGDVATVDVMMMKADLALYRAKNEGRNQFRFHVVELDEQTQERMIIGEELRHAIKRGEFELYYQPQVEVKSGSLVGLETLIRWNHPKRGLMLPAAFIAVAETTGSIVSIGEWVIEHACRQIKAWSDLAIAPPTVAVNLSGAQFKLASQLDQTVIECLTRYDVAPERLELELTESVLIETTQRHGEVFKRLRKIGVRLAIDDFGTGYSSLDYLRSFRVSRLKIDRRFINDVTTSADDAAIVRATIGLARELGIEVIAEGVETAEQRDFLISAGCKLAQGYYFGKPMPSAAASELLRQNFQLAAV